MPLQPRDWHHRFSQQAQWTAGIRRFLFDLAGIDQSEFVLDVGSGTGALTAELAKSWVRHPVGIDLNLEFSNLAAANVREAEFAAADAYSLPFKDNSFDCSFCHYVLMWLEDPLSVLQEMMRVTRPGSFILALAEPDYGGRIDYPTELELINQWQMQSLQIQGADPSTGRRLKGYFHQAGLGDILSGVIGAQWASDAERQDLESEWQLIHHDLATLAKENSEILKISEQIKYIDHAAWTSGERVLFVPTFYAAGRVPK